MKYKTIVVDPPWKYGKWGGCSGRGPRGLVANGAITPLPYQYMTTEEIALLPVKSLTDENCEIYLWTTQKYLPDAINIMSAWGAKYCGVLVWCKEPRGTGQGGLYTPTAEFIVHGRIGKMPIKQRVNSTWFKIVRQKRHSQKPEMFQDIIETVSDEPRIELFARRPRAGWHVWGNEVQSDIVFNEKEVS